MSTEYRNFLALSYEELEELNLQAKKERTSRVSIDEIREKRLKYLTDDWHSEISPSVEHTAARLRELCAPAFEPPPTKRFTPPPTCRR